MTDLHARQAIVTYFIGPTDRLGSRVKAMADAGSITLDWDDRLHILPNHARAATALARKFGWDGLWQPGGMPKHGSRFAYAWVNVEGSGITISKEDTDG